MADIRAFAGHSFTPNDQQIVTAFTKFFDELTLSLPSFSWEHAEDAEPIELSAKVRRIIEDKTLFIGICTRKERVIADEKLKREWFGGSWRRAEERDFGWKTSDWIIQEVGLAVGRGMDIILLIEDGVKNPGALQGDVEYIPFFRDHPETAFPKLMAMIRNLSPKPSVGAVATTEGPANVDPADTSASKDDLQSDLPEPRWSLGEYEAALFRAMLLGKYDVVQTIYDTYKITDDAKQDGRLIGWEAFREWVRIGYGQDGDFDHLQKLAAEHPNNAKVIGSLAKAFAHFDNHDQAARLFASAARLTTNPEDKLRLQGQAIQRWAEGGNLAEARLCMNEARQAGFGSLTLEKQFLAIIREFARITKDDELDIATMERFIEISPGDTEVRFSLAYKHSEATRDVLALDHYLKMPIDRRQSGTWNNIGVSYEKLDLPARAISAFRQSADMGETLAMANLAQKLITAGFLTEARAELDRATKVPDYHKKVNDTLTRLHEVSEKEDEAINESLRDVIPLSKFFTSFGLGVIYPDWQDDQSNWAGPECELSVVMNDDLFGAKGNFRRVNALAGLAIGGSGASYTPPTIRVAYAGRVFGRCISGTVKRTEEQADKSASSMISGATGSDSTEFLMVISADGKSADVVENPNSSRPRFYTLNRSEQPKLEAPQ